MVPFPSDRECGALIDVWHANTRISYAAETCWNALCAALKEEILELMCGKNCTANARLEKIRYVSVLAY